jgi:phosphate starvation-inducible membrane PsiE
MNRIASKLLEFTPTEDPQKRWKDQSYNWRRYRLNGVNHYDNDDFLQYSFTVILMISCNIISLWYWWFPAMYVQCDIDDFPQYSFTVIFVISCNIPSLWYLWFPAIFIHCDTDDFLQHSFAVILMILAIFLHRDINDFPQYSFTVMLMISSNIPSLYMKV